MKSRYYDWLIMSMVLAASTNFKNTFNPTEEDKINLKKFSAERKKQRLLKRGMREFIFDGVAILALNEKNAKRKYDNYKKLTNK